MIYEVRLGTDPCWRSGALPLRVPTRSEAADHQLRLTYFEPRLREALYGSAEAPVRWFRLFEPRERLAGAGVQGIEVLRMPLVGGELGLAVLHVELTDPTDPRRDPVVVLEDLARLSTATAEESDCRRKLEELLPNGVQLTPGDSRARTVAHVTFTDAPDRVMSDHYGDWSPADQWLWLLASASTEARFAPDPEDASVRSGAVLFSADWKALVLRDGMAFVGTSPDSGEEREFHSSAEVYVHSIYLDALLVGCMQLYALNDVANNVAGVQAEQFDPEVLAGLEYRLMHVRRRLWFSHITVHGKGNELLRQFQAQHALPTLLENIISELADAGRLVDALTNRSVNAALGLLTVIGLPVGVAFAAGALWTEPHPGLFLVSVLAAAVGAIALTTVVQPARQMLRTLLRRHPQ
ncbi:hypothetical protein [Streptomyces sp. B6B3]|uniref:hypothetical protein n=1 Tax=Streptomyces sp. B6B3 TaxID=3153570 RepID=UPI00325E24E6